MEGLPVRSNWLISFCLVLLLLISDGAIASGKGVAVSGTVPAAVTNSASLVGIDAPVLKLNVGFDQNQSRMYQLSYAEPDYGTGAGLLNFVHQNSLWQIKYAVASNLVPYVDLGMDVRFLKLTETGDKYISTDFGVQFGDFWLLRLGFVVENLWHLRLGETETPLPMNVIAGAAIDLGSMATIYIDVDDVLAMNTGRKVAVNVETTLFDSVTLKAGWSNAWCVGIGYNYEQWCLDYEWQQGQHQIGIGWRF